jgi:hypothetical protein
MTMSFTYYPTIPNAPDNPSYDQPLMQINSQSINSLIGIDHVTFNSIGAGGPGASGGQHLQVTFNGKNVPGSVTDPLSILYTNSGVASPFADMRFTNQNGVFPVNLVRAYAFCNTAGVAASQMINVVSVIHSATGEYDVTLTTNAVANQNFGILVSAAPLAPNVSIASKYTYSATTGQFSLFFFIASSASAVATDPSFFTFTVLQL